MMAWWFLFPDNLALDENRRKRKTLRRRGRRHFATALIKRRRFGRQEVTFVNEKLRQICTKKLFYLPQGIDNFSLSYF